MAVNPRGQVPTLFDGDIVICESVAALLYLEDAYPEHKLLPTDKKERAAVSCPFSVSIVYDLCSPVQCPC